MQVMSSSLSLSTNFSNFSSTGFPDVDGKFSHDFGVKLQLKAEEANKEQEKKLNNLREMEEEEEEEEHNEEEEDFSFVCLNVDGSQISAEDLFQNDQILPIFPLFNQDLLFADDDGSVLKSEEGDYTLRPQVRKLFVEDSADTTSSSPLEPAGPYCEWRGGRTVLETSSDTCRKSNSTGFSKLWRFRDLKLRCDSDGKDAFVFLSHRPPSSSSVSSVRTEKKNEKEDKKAKVKISGEKPKGKTEKSCKTTSLSAHEKLYVKNRAQREGDKRRSYLPYRQVGFFTNVNGLSRNVHPF